MNSLKRIHETLKPKWGQNPVRAQGEVGNLASIKRENALIPRANNAKAPQDAKPLHHNGYELHRATGKRTGYLPLRRRGAAMTENLLVLGAVVIVLAGIFAAYQTGMSQIRSNRLITNVTQIVGAIDRIYANAPTIDAGNLIPVLAGRGDIPASAQATDSSGNPTVETPYGTAVTIVGDGATNVVLTVNAIPEAACERFLEAFNSSGATSDRLEQLSVNGTFQARPMTASVMAAACLSTSNTIALQY